MALFRRAFKLLVRIETASVLMLLVTLLAALGSLFPQLSPSTGVDSTTASNLRAAVRARYGGWGDLLLFLGVFRFPSSPLFLVPMGLLVVAGAACTLRRWPAVLRRLRWGTPSASHLHLESAPLTSQVSAPANQAAQVVRLSRWLRQQRFNVQQELSQGAVLLHAQRHRWAGAATLGTHLSIVLLVLGAASSTFGSLENQLQIPSGEAIVLGDDQSIALRNDGFSIQRYADGSPADFEAQVTVLDGERIARQVSLRVNQPLRYRGYSVYLSSYWGQPDQYGLVLLVTRNPGYLPFLLGGILLVLSVTLSLYFPHSRIVARVQTDGGVALSGWPARYDTDLGRAWPRLVAALGHPDADDQALPDPASEGAE